MKKKSEYVVTTKKLIEMLQEADPEGNGIIDIPIYTVNKEDLYYDGYPQMLVLDEEKKPYWHVNKTILTDKYERFKEYGVTYKVTVQMIEDEDLVYDDYPVEIDYKDEDRQIRATKRLCKCEDELIKINVSIHNRILKDVKKKLEDGWKAVTDVPKYKGVMMWIKGSKQSSMNFGNQDIVTKYGMFDKVPVYNGKKLKYTEFVIKDQFKYEG